MAEWVYMMASGVALGVALCAALTLIRHLYRKRPGRPFAEFLARHIEMAQALTAMAFWEWDLRSGSVSWIGDPVLLFGAPIRSFGDFKDRLHPGDHDRMMALATEARERDVQPGAEFRIIRPDGQTRWLTARFQIIRDDTGKPSKIFGMNMDIDEHKRAMIALEQSQLEQRIIFDLSPALIWYKDRHNRILRVNKIAAAAAGKLPSEIEGHSTAEFYPKGAAKYYADDLEVINGGLSKLDIFEELTTTKGDKLWLRTDKIPYRDAEGEIIGVIVFSQDITALKVTEMNLTSAMDKACQADRAKSEFLANISHEIRTPLGVIMGFSEMLRAAEVPGERRLLYSDKIWRNSKRLLKLIDEILDLSKIEHGRIKVDLEACSLSAVLADVTSQLGSLAHEKGLEFRVVTKGNIPKTIISDSARLRQILTNVIGNAIKFTSQGSVLVDVASFPEGDTECLTITVKDSGIGMTPQAAAGLFQPFHQVDPDANRKFGGAGLGLALSRRLARAIGGDLTLEATAPGIGSTFQIKILCGLKTRAPATPSDASDGDEQHLASAVISGQLQGMTVLLVEDNPDIQEMVRSFLRNDDVQLTIADDGRSGVDTALRLKPDVVVMDIQLPLLNGLEATRELRSLGFQGPILAMTAHAMAGQNQTCLDAGFSAFATKPLSRGEFIELLASLRVKV